MAADHRRDRTTEPRRIATFSSLSDAITCDRPDRLYPNVAQALGALADRGYPQGRRNKPLGHDAGGAGPFRHRGPVRCEVIGGDSLRSANPDPAPLRAAACGPGADPPSRAAFMSATTRNSTPRPHRTPACPAAVHARLSQDPGRRTAPHASFDDFQKACRCWSNGPRPQAFVRQG